MDWISRRMADVSVLGSCLLRTVKIMLLSARCASGR
jgi:hypothetical protein